MTDEGTVFRRLHALERYAAELDALAENLGREQFDKQLRDQWTVEHGLQLAVECVLDIASHIVSAEGLGPADSYREVIDLLGGHGILPPQFVDEIRRMAGFRNVLVHDYMTVNLDTVWEAFVKGPAQFRQFAQHITRYLRSNPAQS